MLRLILRKSNFLFFLILFFVFLHLSCFAYSTEPVKATVKSSVCGNNILEGGEDCDNDLGEKKCSDFGFSGGNLKCDSSCHFIFSECSKYLSPTTKIFKKNDPKKNIFPLPSVKPIPSILRFFDLNSSGKIEKDEIFNAIKIWVDDWRKDNNYSNKQKNCDLNGDKKCDVQDFSILLYYIEK